MRFKIRDVLWLTVVVAFAVSWWLDHVKTQIDWTQVRADKQEFVKAKQELFFAKMKADIAAEQRDKFIRAAARRGIDYLDIEPESTLSRELIFDSSE